ncbi:hypothetical protein FEM48_Zijuj10G0002200 [Ziziphus jujuba var. spinosa]|uniref:Uncharacterized protein n=1 Tax=Ziziphus jujuba var. spinosa TaxID=714518 RepID=A0A978UK51_ZIZJJ|nr:hypothetical protein FEM48_Zijuj10G0002200 [Ziziphus jujuba var. spinosa]
MATSHSTYNAKEYTKQELDIETTSTKVAPLTCEYDKQIQESAAIKIQTAFRGYKLMDTNSQRRWDDSLLSKEEADASFISKKEALIKRERIKEYWCSHRKSAGTERNKVNGRWRYWLKQWVDTQLNKSKELEDLDTTFPSTARKKDEFGGKQPRLRKIHSHYQNHDHRMDSPIFVPRKSHNITVGCISNY